MLTRPSKATGPQSFLTVVKDEPFKRYSSYSLSPVEVSQVVTHFVEFHLLIWEVALQEVTEMGVWAEPRACRSNRAWFRFFFRTMATFIMTIVLLHTSWDGFFASWKRAWPLCWLYIIKRFSVHSASPQPIRGNSGPYPSEPQLCSQYRGPEER